MQIHQILASLEFGDAIAAQAIALQKQFRAWGHESEIYAHARHPLATTPVRPMEEISLSSEAAFLYHHAFWSEPVIEALARVHGRLGMVYHNVTPAHYYAPYSSELYESARRAREAVGTLSERVDFACTVSGFNRRELQALGYREVSLLPPWVDFESMGATIPSRELMERHRGRTNFLFVGRLSPNKRQEDVIRVFAWYHRYIDPNSRLFLVGSAPEIDLYREDLVGVCRSLGVEDYVVFAGKVSTADLAAYYRSASVFLCMSEHEGFCVPLLEAMFHDLPVVARSAGAIAETMGDAGLLARGRHVPHIAEAIHVLLSDGKLHEEVLVRQRRRLEAYAPDRFVASAAELVQSLGGSAA